MLAAVDALAAGTGELETDGGSLELRAGALVWLRRGARRAVAARDESLRCLSVRRRKRGLRVTLARLGVGLGALGF